MITATAFGKIIFLGEHFVVHGDEHGPVPAIAFPLKNLKTEVSISPSHAMKCITSLDRTEGKEIVETLMVRAAHAAATYFRIDLSTQPFQIISKSNFPMSRGFGSSASFAVALSKAFSQYREQFTKEAADWFEMQKATNLVEKIFHGSPSGIDAATILTEKPILFCNGIVESSLVNQAVDIVVIDSGERERCDVLVSKINQFRQDNLKAWGALSGSIRALVTDVAKNLQSPVGAKSVFQSIREVNLILKELGLNTSSIDQIIADGIEYGAAAGKVSGAGGGGAVLLVAPLGIGEQVKNAFEATGRSVLGVIRGAQG